MKGEELFKFSTSELYLVSGGLSPDGRTVALVGFEQRDASLITHVRFYDVSSGKQISDTELENALGIELCYLDNGSVAVLCDDGLYLVTRRGSSEHALTVGTSDLIAVSTRENAMVLAIRSYSGGARSDLYTVRSGTVYGPAPLDEEPIALAVSHEHRRQRLRHTVPSALVQRGRRRRTPRAAHRRRHGVRAL